MLKQLREYVQEQGLAEGSSEVKLDELLVGNLYNKKEPQQAGNLDDVDEVLRRLLGKLQQFHRVLRQSPQVSFSPQHFGSLLLGSVMILHFMLRRCMGPLNPFPSPSLRQ